jgi:hypothetical protein
MIAVSDTFKILAIDGGGFRGAFAAHILNRIEEEFQVNWQKDFGLIAGTSTGSIIAAGLAYGLSAAQLVEFYERHGEAIFQKRLLGWKGIFASKYSSNALKEALENVFKETKLSDISTPLIIPSTDIGNGRVHVFKTQYHWDFNRDGKEKISDAVLASCSAPTFFNPHKVSCYVLADGGLWANNPSLVAALDAHKRLNIPLSKIKVFSVGTGVAQKFYSQKKTWLKKKLGWGVATLWGRTKFIDMIFNLQSQTADNMLGLLLDKERQVKRINFDSDMDLPLDDVGRLEDWCSRADQIFTYSSKSISDFLSLTKRERSMNEMRELAPTNRSEFPCDKEPMP